MDYQPSSSLFERLRSLFKRRIGDASLAYLGDSDLPGARVDVPGKPGYVYVRFPSGKAASGYGSRDSLTIARSAGVAFPNYPGCPVYVAFKYNNELEVVSAHYAALDRVGINTSVLNPLNQQSRFVYPWQLTYGLANAVATALSNSTKVTVKSHRYYVGNLFQTAETPTADDMINLVSSIPAVGFHRYAAIWTDAYTNTFIVTTSTAQALNVDMDLTDIQELATNRPADAIPYKAFYLANGQTTLRQTSKESDLRQHMATPHVWGFPNILSHIERVWPNRTLVTGPYTLSGVGAITLESGAQIIIVHKNNFVAVTAPGSGDDSGDGYSIGSLWFDTVTGLLYVATSVGVGTATWAGITSSTDTGITQLTGDVTAGPGSGSQAATIPNNTINQAKMADNSVGTAELIDANVTLAKLANGTAGRVLGYTSAGAPTIKPNAVDVPATWGEAVTLNDLVISSGFNWLKASSASQFDMNTMRGVVIESASYANGGAGFVRVEGLVEGLSGLTLGEDLYASSTPGAVTGTPPSPSLGGSTVILARFGYAVSTTAMMVDARNPIQYLKRESLADDDTLFISHHTDPTGTVRDVSAYTSGDDIGLIEQDGGAQDGTRQLKGQSGAGTTTTPDSAGVLTSALGDSGGTERRVGQSMTFTNAGVLTSATINAGATTGSPSGFPTVTLRPDNAGVPSATILDTVTLTAWTASASNSITFTGGVFLETGTTYWLVAEMPAQGTGVFFTVLRSGTNPYANGVMKIDTDNAGTWNTLAAGSDMRCSVTLSALVVTDGLAQGFSHSATTTIPYIDIFIGKVGTRSGTLTLAIQTSTAGLPSGSTITNGSATRSATDVSGSIAAFRFTFATAPTITASTQYHMVLTTSDSASNTDYIQWATDASSPPYANGVFELLKSATWANASPASDGLFEVYGILSTFNEPCVIGRWSGGTRDIAVRFDDGSGGSPLSVVTFKNTSGVTLDVTCVVEFP